MIRGGINDQLGGGFCRYSVDDLWDDPALREDALRQRPPARPVLRRLGGHRRTPVPRCGHRHRGLADPRDAVAARAATSPAWTPTARATRGASMPGTGSGSAPCSARPSTHPSRPSMASTGRPTSRVSGTCMAIARPPRWRSARDCRSNRSRPCSPPPAPPSTRSASGGCGPGLDDKVLTAWNALAIKGMARAARVLDRPDYLESAESALDFLRGTLWRDGRLLATYKDGRPTWTPIWTTMPICWTPCWNCSRPAGRRATWTWRSTWQRSCSTSSTTRRPAASGSPPATTRP